MEIITEAEKDILVADDDGVLNGVSMHPCKVYYNGHDWVVLEATHEMLDE